MIVSMQTEGLKTVEQIREFVRGNGAVEYRREERGEAYGFIRRVLVQTGWGRRTRGWCGGMWGR